MRILPIAFLTSLLLIGAGCFKSPEPTVIPALPNREPDIVVGDLTVQTATIEKSFVLNEFAECVISIKYPDVISGNLPVLVASQADQEMARFITTALGSSQDVGSTQELEPIAQESLDDCQVAIESEYENLRADGEELFTNLKRKIDVVYKVTLNDFHLLTIGLDEQSYTGGAHPSQSSIYLNLDRGGDQLLSLDDVIATEHLKAFLQFEKTQLLAEYRDSVYPEFTDEYDALIASQTPMTAEAQQTTYGAFDNFYLTPTSIVTYYNTYEIAPYAAGPIFVEIPFADIREYINMNGPLVPLVENL